jgi:hypothetical protein
MDRKLRKILTESIRDIETGALDVEGCLQRHPDRAVDLWPHLELWRGLDAAAKAQPNSGSQQRGQHQLLAALSDMETRGKRRMIPFLTPALVKAAAVVAGVVLLTGGAAGASAALGGPNVADEVLTAVGVTNGSDHGPNENANPNASERCGNATQGRGNASENAANSEGHPNARSSEGGANGQPNANANPRASDRCLNADAAGNGAHDPNENANSNASEGAENAEDQQGNADGAADSAPDDVPPDGGPPEDVPPDAVPDLVPVAPQP